MKTFKTNLFLLVAPIFLMAFTSLIRMEQKVISKIEPHPVVKLGPVEQIEVVVDDPVLYLKDTSHEAFLDALGHRESGNRYSIVNTFGYMGKYQFGRKTLNGLGYKHISNKEFLNNPQIQEEAMNALLKHNRKKLRRQIEKYCGKTINGVYITESGILAAAHLAGQGNVKKFFRNGYEFKDGYGTKMTSYMSQFSNYKLNIY